MDSENNVYLLYNFKDRSEDSIQQKVVFYKLNSDGSFEEGTTLEEMLRVCFERLTDLNSRFPCLENDDALKAIKIAQGRLEDRTRDRKERGVEGKHQK